MLDLEDRAQLLFAEIEELAHASPPPSDREVRIRRLKTWVSILRHEKLLPKSSPWLLTGRFALTTLVWVVVIGVLSYPVSSAVGHSERALLRQFSWVEVSSGLVLTWLLYLFALYYERIKKRRLLRQAIAYTDLRAEMRSDA